MSQAGSNSGSGGGSGTLTSITAGTGITLTPNPIIATGTVALTIPVTIADGGTNATAMTNTDGVVYFDGTRLVTTTVGSATQVLTSNGPGLAPTFQAGGGGGIVTLNGNSGSATGNPVSIVGTAALTGSSVTFTATASTVTLNTTDSHNSTYIGKQAGATTPTGTGNVALGFQSLANITSDSQNVAIGADALNGLGLTGATLGKNTAVGFQALGSLGQSTLGHDNTAIGYNAADLLDQNPNAGTAIGNTIIGSRAGSAYDTQESYNILLGFAVQGVETENNTMRLGSNSGGAETIAATFIAGIRGVTTANNDAVAVLIDSAGQLGTVSSSIRYKDNVKDMGDKSSSVMFLRPVTFTYNSDQSKSMRYGLIAEEVNEIMPSLVATNKDGIIDTIKYQDLPVLLLNEIQKMRAEIDSLKSKLGA